MRERKRKRLLRKWRSGWALRTFSGLKKEKLQICLRLCLAAALMWEGAWFACQAVSVETWYQREPLEREAEESLLIRGIRILIEDGKLQLFQIREYAQPESGEEKTVGND